MTWDLLQCFLKWKYDHFKGIMPPKKKEKSDDKNDGKKKGKKDVKKEVVGPLPPEPIDEGSKEFYLIQICDLERRIERCVEINAQCSVFNHHFNYFLNVEKFNVLMYVNTTFIIVHEFLQFLI